LTSRPPLVEHGDVPKRPSSSPRAAAALGALALISTRCASPPAREPSDPSLRAPPKGTAPVPTVSPAPGAGRRPGHTLVAQARDVPVPFAIQPVPGGRSVLLVSQFAGERAAWARRLDGKTGAPGPLVRFADQHVFGAFDWGDGSSTFVTSDGARVCLTGSAHPGEHRCAPVSPGAIVPVGERLALLELAVMRPPEPAIRAAPRPKPREHKGGAARSAKKKKPGHGASPARKPSHPLVEVLLRWAEREGAFDAEARPTGLHFEAPIDGMTLVDARARPPGIDVLWFETAPKRKSRTPLGSGRLMAASLRADGSLDFGSRVAVLDADLEYGWLKDHRAPRLFGGDPASVFLGLDGKGQCEAIRVRPSLSRLGPPAAVCAVAPDRLAGPIEPADLAVFERILADDPRRVPGQPRSDPGLAAWAGDRAFWQRGGKLRSAGPDGAPRDEPVPFEAHRARIAWGSIAADGEGVAFAGGEVVRVDPRAELGRAAGKVAASIGAPELPVDRRRAARIGAAWWIARGDRVRVWPDPAAPVSTGSHRAAMAVAGSHVDTSVLTGGAERGLLIEVSGGGLLVSAFDPGGATARLEAIAASPVRPGFDACERAAGGALVAGVSAADPAKVVAFVADAGGHAGPARPVPLPVRAGDLAVRLTALPAGGALLTDEARRRVVWLDDEARPLAEAPWPGDESDAACADGRPARLSIPAPTPGQFVRVPDAAEGACVVGEMTWGRDGALRWFGSTIEGLDAFAEIAVLPLLPPVPVPVPVPVPAPAPALPLPRSCSPDMVSIAGRFCIDRFEAMIIDARTGDPLSPDFPATPNLLDIVLGEWSTSRERTGNVHARAFPLPWIAPGRLGDRPEPLAVSRLGVRPSGYLTGLVAESACAAAGKRLCSLDEFVTACRGEADTLFPYGDTYEDGVCNVFRDEHPAAILHNNASIGHLDPRLNRVKSKGQTLLRRTGGTPACRSRWGSDAVYDMVGNIDEWVDEGAGAFAGGFYSRSTRSGCEALVTAHPKGYLDYSTGARCCRGVE
jgi:hypothetical protein